MEKKKGWSLDIYPKAIVVATPELFRSKVMSMGKPRYAARITAIEVEVHPDSDSIFIGGVTLVDGLLETRIAIQLDPGHAEHLWRTLGGAVDMFRKSGRLEQLVHPDATKLEARLLVFDPKKEGGE